MPALRRPAAGLQLLHHRQEGLVLQVEFEDRPDLGRLVLVDDQLERLGVDVVPEDRVAAGPLPLPPGRRDLVPGPLADDLPLELGEGKRTFRTSRPMLLAVLNWCVTDTNDTR